MNDEETIAYYSSLADELGGSITVRYQNAIYLVFNETQIYEYMGEDIASERFYIVSKPHKKRNEGFLLDSLSVHIESGKYYYDMDGSSEKYLNVEDGFAAFFQRVIEKAGNI